MLSRSGNRETHRSERHSALEDGRCPDCGSTNGYWWLGSDSVFRWVCDDCDGVFNENTGDRIPEKVISRFRQ